MRMSKTLSLTLIALLALAPLASADSSCLTKGYDIEDLASIVRNEGYGSVNVIENRIHFKADGTQYMLLLYDDGDLQLFFGIAGARLALEDINEWNRSKRLARAYLDADRDPVVECDLLAGVGLTEEIVADFISVFTKSLAPAFRNFVNERNRR